MAAVRKADVVWIGDLLNGNGLVNLGSGAVPEFSVTWASRTEQPGGKTSPEELLAAAHASCFSMAFSAGLARNRTPPTQLHVTATSTFDKVGEGWKVTKMELSVSGKVPGVDQAKFSELAQAAGKNCPISNALKGNVEIVVIPKLDM
jgi:lipoyl-dependent peroxiredoxin